MSQSDRSERDDTGDDRRSTNDTSNESTVAEGAAGWFAMSTLRVGLALVGLVLLLFALGQVAGLDLLGLVVDALTTQVGRWLVVAIFALIIIAIAVRGFDAWST